MANLAKTLPVSQWSEHPTGVQAVMVPSGTGQIFSLTHARDNRKFHLSSLITVVLCAVNVFFHSFGSHNIYAAQGMSIFLQQLSLFSNILFRSICEV